MKLYCTRIYYADGVALHWTASKHQAVRDRKMLAENFAYADGTPAGIDDPDAMDVPTDRAGLVRWLNSKFNADNG